MKKFCQGLNLGYVGMGDLIIKNKELVNWFGNQLYEALIIIIECLSNEDLKAETELEDFKDAGSEFQRRIVLG